MIQTQLTIQTYPTNVLCMGYNNLNYSNLGLIIGSKNKLLSSMNSIIGEGNQINNNSTSNSIVGGNNILTGNNNYILGVINNIKGNILNISGNGNNIKGNGIYVYGNNNNTISGVSPTTAALIKGDSNLVYGNNVSVYGDNNIIKDGYINTFVIGNGNYLNGGVIQVDLTAYTMSVFTGSIAGTPTSGVNVNVYGDKNIIGTNSVYTKVFGNYNNITASASNQTVFGNNITTDETHNDTFVVGNDLLILGQLKNSAIVEQYTPYGATDSYGVAGSFAMDNNNLYLKNNIGWFKVALMSI